VVWESLDYICAERITPALLTTAEHLARFGELELTEELEEQIGRMGIPRVARILKRFPQRRLRLPRRWPKQAIRLQKNVPMVRLDWSMTEPGFFETDLVRHCGRRASGTADTPCG
jgi:hypothetical protein